MGRDPFESEPDEEDEDSDDDEEEEGTNVNDLDKLFVVVNLSRVKEEGEDAEDATLIFEAKDSEQALKKYAGWRSENGYEEEDFTAGVVCLGDMPSFEVCHEVSVRRKR